MSTQLLTRTLLLTTLTITSFAYSQDDFNQQQTPSKTDVKTSSQPYSEVPLSKKPSVNYDAKQALLDEYQIILTRWENAEKDTLAIKEKISQSSGIDKSSLELRQFEYAVDMLKQLDALTQNIDQQNKMGINTTKTVTNIQHKFMSYGPMLRNAINNNEQNFSHKKSELENNTTQYILAFSKHLNFVDTALSGLFNHVNNLQILGLNNDHSTSYMEAELKRRAELLTGQLQLMAATREAFEQKLQQNDKDQAALDQLNFTDEKTQLISASLRNTTKLMSAAGLDSTAYKSTMIESTGHISTDILNIDVLRNLASSQIDSLKTSIKTDGVELAFRVFLFLAVIFAFWLLSLLTRLILKITFDRNASSSHLMRHMMTVLIARSVLAIGFLVALSQLGVSLLPVLTGLGIAGFIIGFALQDTLANFASGMMILLYRPYDVGDMVQAGTVFGRVSSMNLVSTTIMTIDNQTLVLPNNKIWGDVITNVTDQKTRRIDMSFNLPLDSDTDASIDFFKQLIQQQPQVLEQPEPLIELHSINNYALEFIVRPWVNTEDYWPTFWAINAEVKRQLDKKQIKLPVQQHQIILQQEG